MKLTTKEEAQQRINLLYDVIRCSEEEISEAYIEIDTLQQLIDNNELE